MLFSSDVACSEFSFLLRIAQKANYTLKIVEAEIHFVRFQWENDVEDNISKKKINKTKCMF